MEKINEKQIASYVMDALDNGPYGDMFSDYGLQPVRQKGSYAIEFRPIHPRSGEPREGETFTMVVNKTGAKHTTFVKQPPLSMLGVPGLDKCVICSKSEAEHQSMVVNKTDSTVERLSVDELQQAIKETDELYESSHVCSWVDRWGHKALMELQRLKLGEQHVQQILPFGG